MLQVQHAAIFHALHTVHKLIAHKQLVHKQLFVIGQDQLAKDLQVVVTFLEQTQLLAQINIQHAHGHKVQIVLLLEVVVLIMVQPVQTHVIMPQHHVPLTHHVIKESQLKFVDTQVHAFGIPTVQHA